jgi:hypothetical protein
MTNGCVMEARGACYGELDSHHVISRQRLRLSLGREKGIAAAEDARGQVALCRYHHARIIARCTKLHEHEIPSRVWEFATDLGLVWSLEKDIEASGAEEKAAPEEAWESQDQLKERLRHAS